MISKVIEWQKSLYLWDKACIDYRQRKHSNGIGFKAPLSEAIARPSASI
jgi:hypothetical protein